MLVCAVQLSCSGPPLEDVPPDPGADAGTVAPITCDSPEDCRLAGVDGACRQGLCRTDVLCAEDAECGLGERCQSGRCRFAGCLEDSDCEIGRCRTDVFACTECSEAADCPATAPVCNDEGRCIGCLEDADCTYPGPGYCQTNTGTCAHCLQNSHCPSGLTCGPTGTCQGAQRGQSCADGQVECDVGLMCVQLNGNSMCLEACNLYTPGCADPEICVKLTFADSPSLVFEDGAPLGVCYPPFAGAPGYRQACNDNCQPNLACIADSSQQKSCKAYCDPKQPFCAAGEVCHSFPGDYSGRSYGVCYADNGFADACDGDGDCKAGLSCVPRDDPSTVTDLSTACAFDVGAAPGLGACTRDADCRSGACRADPGGSAGASPFFCFAACAEDADCTHGDQQGLCDRDFLFTTAYVPAPGQPVRGCRPACGAPADCADYGAASGAYTCVASIAAKPLALKAACAAPVGTALLGESCFVDTDCREGHCQFKDGRGVDRWGVCSHPCEVATDCGLAAGLTCAPRALLASVGSDQAPNTGDDVHLSATFCGGAACAANADCTRPGTVCTVDADPANPLGALTTVCLPTALASRLGGEVCTSDGECQSGACAEFGASGARACLQPCLPASPDCPGNTTCQAGAARVRRADGTFQNFDACLPTGP